MTILFLSLLLVLSIVGSFIVDVQTMIYMWVIYLMGVAISTVLNKGENKTNAIKIYQILFFAGATYMLMLYAYMKYHNYEYLLVYDSFNAFIPRTEAYLENGSYFQALKEVWSKYSLLDRFQSGYYTYALFFAYLGKPFNLNFLVEQQISVLFIFPFIGILLYKIFRLNYFDNKKSVKYSLLICCFSIVFTYSSLVLRDLHILLLYLLAIFFSLNKVFRIITLIKIILIAFACMTFRVESGLFLFLLVPTYLLVSIHNKKQRNLVIYVSSFVILVLASFTIVFYNQISNVYEANQEVYVEKVAEGSGVIASLQKVPIAGDFASIIYNAVQPLPFWGRFSPKLTNETILGKEIYNIMNFPRSISSFFNWFVIVYILHWLFSKGIKEKTKGCISKPLQYQLWIGLIFLYIQSAVVEQRRIMAYYCIFYILFFVIYNRIGTRDKKNINLAVIFSFIAVQILSYIYIS